VIEGRPLIVNTRTWPAKQPYYRRPYRLELLWKPRSDTQVPGTWYSVLNTCYLILYTWYFCTWTMSIASSVPGSAICLLRFFPSALYVMNLPSPDCQFRALELCNNNCKNDVNLFDDAWISGSASLSLTTEPVSFTASSLHPMLTRHGVSSGVRPDRRQSPGLLRFTLVLPEEVSLRWPCAQRVGVPSRASHVIDIAHVLHRLVRSPDRPGRIGFTLLCTPHGTLM
jgi:hypothetical protein